MDPLRGRSRRRPWSLLQTQWLDVPLWKGASHGALTWGAFSESLEGCLRGVSRHVARRVEGRTQLENVMTKVFVENLDVVVSKVAETEKMRRLRVAADRLLARGASGELRGMDGCALGDRRDSHRDREGDV